MTKRPQLPLHEELMLLALCAERGTIELGAWYQQAVGGAVLAELLLAERIRLVQDGARAFVEVIRSEHLDDELLDEWLDRIAADGKRRKVGDWARRIASTKDLKGRVGHALVRRGILRCEEDKLLLFFRREIYPEVDPRPERKLRERMHDAVFGDSAEVDPRTVVLISLAKGTGLLEVAFDKRELGKRKQRIERLVNGEATGKAVRDLVQATTVAIATACITPVICS